MNGGVTTNKSTGTNDFTLNSLVNVQSPSASVVTNCADKISVMRRSPVVVVEPHLSSEIDSSDASMCMSNHMVCHSVKF